MPLEIVRNDITKMQVDAIVNAANRELQMGGGVCGAIFHAAGAEKLQQACNEIGYCPVGEAVSTEAFKLDAKYIIHTVGPIWHGGKHKEEERLRSCYANSLRLAHSLTCDSIAFPLISSGIYGYPKEQALQVAISEIHRFLMEPEHEMLVYLVVFDQASFGFSEKLSQSIGNYLDEHYVHQQELKYARNHRISEEVFHSTKERAVGRQSINGLEEALSRIEGTFSDRLLQFIDEKGMTDTAVYKKANIDRRLFSKIRNSPDYTPLKKTVFAFAIALELDLEETAELLRTAGYAFSHSQKFDVIIEYFITHQIYDIFEINEALFAFEQKLLGA
ncbi:macro domain-containing protein [Planococcus ruber]|uniref:macro domain-containing protein n=1 Tax=Planococcus ruber TaxID=2027871 RepID=UPI001FF070AF|nr:macro domain-containing protein [Planococcus ruber]MCJ1907527.1 macro domain-containing protein [Planococcus ruber]